MNILYKYKPWDKYTRNLVAQNEFYFPSPSKLNDPYDCLIEPTPGPATRLEKLNHAAKWLETTQGISSEQAYDKARKAIKRGTKTPAEKNPKKFWEKIRKDRDGQYGILSLTEDPNNVLMWTHYAKDHKGICLGLDVESLTEFINKIALESGPVFYHLKKVVYHAKYPAWNWFRDDGVAMLKKSLSTKSAPWSYETEHRLFLERQRQTPPFEPLTEQERVVSLPDGIVKEVLLGLNITSANEAEVKQILKKRSSKIVLKKAKRAKNKYMLKFERTSYNV